MGNPWEMMEFSLPNWGIYHAKWIKMVV